MADVNDFILDVTNNTGVNTGGGLRFFEGFPWRFTVSDLQLRMTTWAQGLWVERAIMKNLNQPTVITGGVYPDDFRVNGVFDDFYRRVAQSNRILLAWRRDGITAPYWNLRAAGIIMQPDDSGDDSSILSRITAYDPWKLLEARPVMDSLGQLPPSGGATNGLQLGILNAGATGDKIALWVLGNTIYFQGGVFIDAGSAYGGTTQYDARLASGDVVLETTGAINLTANSGMTVADVWNQLVTAGNMDIVLTPIWDPSRHVVNPSTGKVEYFTHELNIYKLAGKYRPNARFSWDRLNRSTSNVERVHDATPGSFFDKVLYFVGQGGPPINGGAPIINPAALAAFGSYWATQYFPSESQAALDGPLTLAYAKQALSLAKQGARTVTITTIPERAPIPLSAYDIADFVSVHASERLRTPIDGFERVQTIPIAIDDNGIETVRGLVVSPDWRGSLDPPPSGPPSEGQLSVISPAQTDARNRIRTTRTTSGLSG